MSKLEKLFQRIISNPKNVRFEELEKALLRRGFSESQSGGGSSHYIFKKDGVSVTIPRHGKFVGEVYVHMAIAAMGI